MPGRWGDRNWRNAARNRDSWQKLLKKDFGSKEAVVPVTMMIIMMMMVYVCEDLSAFKLWRAIRNIS